MNTRDSGTVIFPMPALRTHAKPSQADPRLPTGETAALSATSGACPNLSRSAFYFYPILLPAHAGLGPEAPPASPPATTRHYKGFIFQAAVKPGLNDLADVSLHKRNYPDAARKRHFVQGP